MIKFRDLRVGDRFNFTRLGAPVGRYIKVADHRYEELYQAHKGTHRARGGEAVNRLPPEPTEDEVKELAGMIAHRDAGPE